MIISFIAGWIGGVIGTIMYAHYWVRKHTKVVKVPPLENKSEEVDRYDGT